MATSDTGPNDAGPNDTGPNDTGPNDTGPNDTGPNDMRGREGAGQAEDAGAPDRRERRMSTVGVVLVIVGALALLGNLGVFQGIGNVIGMAIFAVLGGLALNHYLRRRRIRSLIGAFVLFGLAAATVGGGSAGFYFLGLIGVGFAAVYYVDRERWWAIIPAGTLMSLAVVAGLSSWAPGYDPTWVLFLGLALTFGVIYLLPGTARAWAIYVALACLVLAVLGVRVGGNWLVPIALVVIGLYMLVRQGAERERGRMTAGPAAGGSGERGEPGAADGRQGAAPTPDATEAPAGEAPTASPGESGAAGEASREED